jgi:FkbM family methyltransferase
MRSHETPDALRRPLASESFTYRSTAFTVVLPGPEEHIGRVIARAGSFYETDALETIQQFLKDRPRPLAVVDVGAFCGNHTLFFATQLDAERVFAFEPTPGSFDALCETIRVNRLTNVVARNIALGDADTTGFIVETMAGNRGANVVAAAAANPDATPTRVSTLDRAIHEAGPLSIAMIKVDVEGAELQVLKGAVRTIALHRPILCVEFHTSAAMRAGLRELPSDYVVRRWVGDSPTFVLSPSWLPGLLARAVNRVWALLLGREGGRRWAWRWGRLVDVIVASGIH